ncbi:Glycinol 4-dimethylallyltransferase [Heracleum sosnowskyi]|uniref:Glycinol 4-dimethylallyltransferase n=1 Tax=Heracleum sosnowskyi TaxID=360622 RepID=A0AAD8I485_9APIA|nr:Glycinol 4-dimethylallyltransferase [Heracleum sosnowskyi]
MIQTINSASFSLHLQHGFPASLQQRRRQMLNALQYKEDKFSKVPGLKGSTLNNSFESSYGYKLVRKQKVDRPPSSTQSENEFILQPQDDHIMTFQSSLGMQVALFLRFCRPHSIIGTIIGVTSVSLLPITSIGDLSPAVFTGLLKALIPMACMNTYVTCVNQVADVEIDKINKPHFVLAAGEYTIEQGKAIVAALALMSLGMGIMFKSPPIFAGLLVYFLLGTAYSVELPLLRWKKNPFLAALCLVAVCGLIIPLVAFIHMEKYVLRRQLVFTRSLGFTIFAYILFGIVIALMKDIPDVEGDRVFGIQTFSLLYDKKKVFDHCISIMLTVYGFAMVIGALSSSLQNKLIYVFGHCALGFIFWTRAQSLNLDDNLAVESFYMFFWKLYYVEYVLIHFLG